MRILLLVFLSMLLSDLAAGQKFLQLEKLHSPRTRKYYPGQEITFQEIGGQWYTRVIEDVSYDQSLVLFANGHVHTDSIIAFRSFKNRQWSRPVGNQLFNFAIAWTGFSLIADAVSDEPEDEYTRGDAILAGSSVLTGIAIKKLFKRRTFKLTKNKNGEPKRWRLRVLDLEIKNEN